MPQPLRGALIGAGAISHYHLSAWEKIPQVEIIAICDPNRQNAEGRAAEFGIPPEMVFIDPSEMFRSIAFDFVDIAAPPEAHLELTELAAAHHVHVNCQKTLCPESFRRPAYDGCLSAGGRATQHQ